MTTAEYLNGFLPAAFAVSMDEMTEEALATRLTTSPERVPVSGARRTVSLRCRMRRLSVTLPGILPIAFAAAPTTVGRTRRRS